jgi:AcrR family transcriptional regulator
LKFERTFDIILLMPVPDTKQRILDAAEVLFASGGYNGTSIRAISKKAGSFLSAVNYHFGSKEALLHAVLERRLTPLNETRTERLTKVIEFAKKKGTSPRVRDVIEAFIEPTLEFRASPEAKPFMAVMAQMHSAPGSMKAFFFRLMRPVVTLFQRTLREALPDMKEDELKWKFQFMMGAMVHSMLIGIHAQKGINVDFLPPEIDTGQLTKMMISFLTAGMKS